MTPTPTSSTSIRHRRGGLFRAKAALLAVALLAGACGGDDGESVDGREPPPEEAEWPQVGLDLANTRAAVAEAEISPDNVDTLAPAWELDGVNGVTSTPIVTDGVAYLGDWTGHVRALDVESGEEQWATNIETQYIGGAVAVDDERVFAGTFGNRLVALDRASGEVVWEEELHESPFTAIFGSPVYVDGMVLVGLASFENMVGSEGFTFRGAVVALDAETGDEQWRYWTTEEDEGPGVSVWSSPAVDTELGLVYVGTGQHYAPPATGRSDSVIALDLTTGEERWVHQFTEGDVWTLQGMEGPDSDVGTPPNLFEADGVAAVGAGDKAGHYKALDRETGDELWSVELTEGSLQGGVMASAAVHDGVIYVSSNKGGGPADLFALDADNGEILWQIDVGGSMVGPVTWANGVVYAADNNGRISGYDAENGDVLWSHDVPAQAAGGVTVVDGTVYAGYGWWLTAPPAEPEGGLIAFRPGGERPEDSTDGGAEEETDGATIFQQNCATCHGGEGSGGSALALTDVSDRLSTEELVEIVTEGRGDMPSWEGTLSPEEIEAVVEYLESGLGGG